MALWYKNTGPWWDNTNLRPNDGISLEEERKDPNSLFNFYKEIIRLRESNEALSNGGYQTLPNSNSKVLSFLRREKNAVCVMINLSDQMQKVVLNLSKANVKVKGFAQLSSTNIPKISGNSISVSLPGFSMQVLKIR
jgi:alpha-amylase